MWLTRQDTHVVDVMRGASIAGSLKIISGGLQFSLNVVLGRLLGVEGAGVYFLALTIVTIASTIGRVGLDSTVIRFVSASASAQKWAEVIAVYRAAILIAIACSVVILGVVAFSTTALATLVFSEPALVAPLRAMGLAIVPLALNVVISRALQGLSDIRNSVLVFSILPTGLALCGTLLLATSWAVSGAAIAYVVGISISVVYGAFAWRRAFANSSFGYSGTRNALPVKTLLASGPPLLTGALLQLVISMSGTLLLGVWAETRDVSIFAVAWRTALLINLVLLAVNSIAQPKFAALYARNEMKALAVTTKKVTLLMTALATPPFLVLLLAPTFVMKAFGSDFGDGATTLQVLAVGQFINVATGSVGVLLVMCGYERDYRNVQVAAAGVVLMLSYLLTPAYGAVGAAIAAASALIVQNVWFGYLVWVRLGILGVGPRSSTDA